MPIPCALLVRNPSELSCLQVGFIKDHYSLARLNARAVEFSIHPCRLILEMTGLQRHAGLVAICSGLPLS
jgi:hypothetical protein